MSKILVAGATLVELEGGDRVGRGRAVDDRDPITVQIAASRPSWPLRDFKSRTPHKKYTIPAPLLLLAHDWNIVRT